MRTFSPEAEELFDKGEIKPYIRVWLAEDPTQLTEWVTPLSFTIKDTEAEFTSWLTSAGTPPYSIGNYIVFERGIYVNGIPETTKTSHFYISEISCSNNIHTVRAKLLSPNRQTLDPNLTYLEVLDSLYVDVPGGNKLISPSFQFPDDDIWGAQFLPPGKGLSLQNANNIFTQLRQKYLIFARHTEYQAILSDAYANTIYFFQPTKNKSGTTLFPNIAWELFDPRFTLIINSPFDSYRSLLWRDENSTIYTYSMFSAAPIHNLGFIPSNIARPEVMLTNNNGSFSSQLKVDLRRESGDVFSVEFNNGSGIVTVKGVAQVEEYFDSSKPVSWWQIVRILKVFDNTEGGALPSTIERVSSYTPLNTSYFNKILSVNDNNIQAAFETLDDHDHDLGTLYADTKDPTGWLDPAGITVKYSTTTRKITLTGSLVYYWQGERKELTSPWTSDAHSATAGNYFLYSTDGTSFAWSSSPWSFFHLMVAKVALSTSPAYQFAIREVHGLMPWQVHKELHEQISSYRDSGGALTAGTYAENTATDAATTPGFDAAVMFDEDIQTNIPAWTQGSYTCLRFNSGAIANFSTESFPFRNASSGYIYFNTPATGAETQATNNRYLNIYQILVPATADTASQAYRMVMLQPQAQYTSLTAAQAEDPRGLTLGNLASTSPEFVLYARITYVTASSDSNTGKCRIATGGITYLEGSRVGQVSVSGYAPPTAENVPFSPTGNIAATNVQAALAELDNEKSTTTHTHAAREQITAGRTYYVRTDGSDSNDGLANTAGGAFLTIQRAIDVAAAIDRSIYTVTIQVGNGTYAENILTRNGVGSSPIVVQGDTTTPGNVIIQPASGIGIYSLGIKTTYTFQGFRLVANPSGFAAMTAEDSYFRFSAIEFSSGWSIHIYTVYNGFIEALGNYSIIAGASTHVYGENHGVIKVLNRTLTITGTPAFSSAFARAVSAHVTLSGNTYSGSATGTRYSATLNGVISTNGATLPGNAAGTTATGGQYA